MYGKEYLDIFKKATERSLQFIGEPEESDNVDHAVAIHIDNMDWDFPIGPTHIMINGDDPENIDIVPVFLGMVDFLIGSSFNQVSIFVKSTDHDKINHEKAYVFIHDPYLTREIFVSQIVPEHDILESYKHSKNSNPNTMANDHIHITPIEIRREYM
jgi:hypothetical protein